MAFGYRRDDIGHPLQGTAFVVPRAEHPGLLAANVLVLLLFFHVIPNADMAESRGPLTIGNYLRPSFVLAIPLSRK